MKYIFIGLLALLIYSAGVFSGGVATLIATAHPEPTPIVYPTGYDILNAANEYRESKGLPDLILSEKLCNNIAERAINYEKTNSHSGLKEWAQKNGITDHISEILAYGTTASEVINDWAGSPSHNLALLNNTHACSYSSNGFSVMELQ